ncbi:nucleus accumbens-associated protein 1-like [Anolis sagrei]|uniref:nucleus accumbens-associated protein 1-like n=1 Tax=Anolis sagrei TaxID=38937 RepID=UPI0035215017
MTLTPSRRLTASFPNWTGPGDAQDPVLLPSSRLRTANYVPRSKMAPACEERLLFRFPGYGEGVLRRMDRLREQRRFCDVTVRLGGLRVPGHRVVFAAGSPFLRERFLLSESPEVRLSLAQGAEVGRRLLLCCYTGRLEVPLAELTAYLSAASALQMVHVAERCAQALSRYLAPKCHTKRIMRNGNPSIAKAEEGCKNAQSVRSGSKMWDKNNNKRKYAYMQVTPKSEVLNASGPKDFGIKEARPVLNPWHLVFSCCRSMNLGHLGKDRRGPFCTPGLAPNPLAFLLHGAHLEALKIPESCRSLFSADASLWTGSSPST